MSHIVIHDDENNVTQYVRFDDVQEAAAYLEDLHSRDAAANARLFALQEVKFAVRSYVKVEIGDGATEEPAPAAVVEPPPIFTDAPGAPAAGFGPADATDPVVDDVEYVEAAMGPVDTFSPVAEVDDTPPAEVRRGLFGR